MTPERWRRIDEVFGRAVELATIDRAAFVRASCGDDDEIYAEVIALLASDADASVSLRAVIDHAAPAPAIGSPAHGRLAGRFTIRRQLGAGGMAVVYEAFDDQRGELVALKMLPRVGPREIADLKREFRTVANIVHPNLVRLHELFSDGDRWFFTMARVDGVPFVEHVRRRDALDSDPLAATQRPTLDEPVLRRALRGLCEGVRAIHAAGQLHRDLKPSNVLVDGTGHVTILDFGLARRMSSDGDSSRELGGAGTPAYMAPEQVHEAGARPASDWYAVGGMLFESLTGKRPFEATNLAALLAAKQSGPPPNLREALASAPRDLAELAIALLAHDPAARPAEAAIFDALGEVARPPPAEPEPEALFVGRKRELRALADAFATVVRGGASVVYVTGTSGIGKTALCDRFLTSVRERALVLRGRCYERENVPFKAFDEVIDALGRHLARLDAVAVAKLTPRYAGELCRVFPVLGKLPAFADEPVGQADPAELRRRAFVALEELLGRLAARRPVVIAIDDLQWGDADSAVLLARLVGTSDPPAVLWLGTYRSEDPARSPVLARLAESAPGRTLSIEPLGDTDGRELARTLVGDELAESIATEAAGSPFFIRELAHRARDGAMPAKLTVAEAVATRVAQLPEDARRLLEIVAVAGRPLSIAVALEASGLARADDAAVPLLRTAGLIRGAAGAIESYHDRIRETVAGGLAPETRTRHHRALAETLDRAGGDDASPEILALHYRGAGEDGRALAFARTAAVGAMQGLAFDRAIEHYRMALELAKSRPREERSELQRGLGDALAEAGRGPEAADVYLEAAEGAPDQVVLVLERAASRQLLICGHLERGLAIGRRVLRRLGVWFPRSPRVALLLAVLRLAWLWLFARRLPRLRTASEVPPRRRARVEVERELWEGLALSETIYSFYFATSLATHAWRLGETYHLTWATGAAGFPSVALLGRITKRSRRWLDQGYEVAAHLTERERALCLMCDGAAAFVSGHWVASHRHIRDGLERLAGATDTTWMTTVCDALASWGRFYRGRLRELSERCPELLATALLKNNRLAANAQATAFSTVAWLVRDVVDGAEREVAAAEQRWPKDGFQLPDYWILLSRAFLGLYKREGVRGHAYMVARWPALRRSQLLNQQITRNQLVQLRASLALAGVAEVGDRATREQLLREARRYARTLAKIRVRGSRPLAELLLAGVAATRGDIAEARELLARAAAGCAADDMQAYAAAARYRLGTLRNDTEGQALRADAERWFRDEGVVDVERLVGLLAPGFAKLA